MFDIGFMEILMIGVVSLVVIGPERLPEVAAKVGKTVAKARRFVQGVRSDITRELEAGDLKKMIGDQKEQINEDPEGDLIDVEIAEDELHVAETKADLAADAAQIEHSKNTDDASDLSENKAS